MKSHDAIRFLLDQHQRLDEKLGDLWIQAKECANGVPSADLAGAVEKTVNAFTEHEAEEQRLLGPVLARCHVDRAECLDYLALHRREIAGLLEEVRAKARSPSLTEQQRAEALLELVCQLFAYSRREERELVWELMGRPSYVTDGVSG